MTEILSDEKKPRDSSHNLKQEKSNNYRCQNLVHPEIVEISVSEPGSIRWGKSVS